jgi:hypothetical protein
MISMAYHADVLKMAVTPADVVIPLLDPEAFKRFPEGKVT